MRRHLSAVLALAIGIGLLLAAPALAVSLDNSIPWHEKSIADRKNKIAEYEAVLHEYDRELRALTESGDQAAKRRTEIRIIKKYYNGEIDSLKDKIEEHYRRIQELKAKGGS